MSIKMHQTPQNNLSKPFGLEKARIKNGGQYKNKNKTLMLKSESSKSNKSEKSENN